MELVQVATCTGPTFVHVATCTSQFVQAACTSCNLYRFLVQIAIVQNIDLYIYIYKHFFTCRHLKKQKKHSNI